MADVRYPRDVYGQETRYCNPFTSIATVENRQDTVDAYERRTEKKCELHNPFRRDDMPTKLRRYGPLSLPPEIPSSEP